MPLLLPESLDTVATLLSEELQISEARVCARSSLNVPLAFRLTALPADMQGLGGVMPIAARFCGASVLGWYNSAPVKPELKSLQPPATRTLPSPSKVAV